mgnify:CR=1 FL=1
MSDPCDGHTAACWAEEERAHARQAEEEQRLEEEHDAAVDQWIDDVMTYAAEVVPQHARDWALYALALKNGDTSIRQPVLIPAPLHPDDRPADSWKEIPF